MMESEQLRNTIYAVSYVSSTDADERAAQTERISRFAEENGVVIVDLFEEKDPEKECKELHMAFGRCLMERRISQIIVTDMDAIPMDYQKMKDYIRNMNNEGVILMAADSIAKGNGHV